MLLEGISGSLDFFLSFFFSFDQETCEEKFVEFRATVQCPKVMNSQVSEAVILKVRGSLSIQ